MNGRQFTFGASGNPLAQILSALLLGAFAVVAVIMGAFVFLGFLGLAAVAFIVLAVRGWWLRRGLERRAGAPRGGRPAGESGRATRLIEAEYTVVESDDDRRDTRGRR